jgi:hypothetical protein
VFCAARPSRARLARARCRGVADTRRPAGLHMECHEQCRRELRLYRAGAEKLRCSCPLCWHRSPRADHPGVAEVQSAFAGPDYLPVRLGHQHCLPLMDGDLGRANLNLERHFIHPPTAGQPSAASTRVKRFATNVPTAQRDVGSLMAVFRGPSPDASPPSASQELILIQLDCLAKIDLLLLP